jgi:hypothetical protein
MRGMTGSLGSGGDTWVAKATPPPQTTQPTHTHQASGTSFVMGGGGLGRPSNKPQSGREQGAEESWRSFDSRSIRENGGARKADSDRTSYQPRPIADVLSTSKGQRLMTAVLLYGLVIFGLIYLLCSWFGDGRSDDFYNTPSSLSPHARPLWDR